MTLAADTIYRRKAASRGRLFSLMVLFARAAAGVLQRRRTMKALNRLSDRGLRDIGLVRTSCGYEFLPDELSWKHRR